MWNWLGGATPPVVPPESDAAKSEAEEPNESAAEEGAEQTPGTSTAGEKQPDDLDIGIATENVKQVASKLGSYLYGFASAATSTATKLKDTAAAAAAEQLDKGILADFQRENDKFKQENETRRIGDGVPPWEGYHEEAVMKRQILALSTDERNFLRSPPSGVDFIFDVEQKMPVAMATLKEDENLEKMRFQLVPKKIKEEKFWRNYFYRVSLVKQSTQLSSMADQEMKLSQNSSSTESLNKTVEVVQVDVHQEKPSEETEEDLADNQLVGSPPTNSETAEFVSDSFQGEEGLSEAERIQMMGEASEDPVQNSSMKSESDDWEFDKELQDEIESFELVNENSEDTEHWEKEIEDLIDMEDS